MAESTWSLPFLSHSPPSSSSSATETTSPTPSQPHALIILNQPFSLPLLHLVWRACTWHCCADGGANRLHDVLKCTPAGVDERSLLLPDLIKGDLDSLRGDVTEYYASQGVPIVHDPDQYSTDLMKCIHILSDKEKTEGITYDIIILGGLSGRLDQTVHTLSLLHKLRKSRKHIYAISDDNLAWVLDKGEHHIRINHELLGPTCGLLPVGIDSTSITTRGLRWNLTDCISSFDGMVSTSNHLLPGEDVWIKTTKPIWWTVELRTLR
ncbi:thiamine pyrophosphokinase [Sparassis latifolia]|uniref:Thiamine pyrophosphokinase n=1 Tax=Sparassis crispa TaxID=139825 RepID=A0A401H086_9APHY|nr:Thiamin pyrophosphokinase 1 [Sparassis crispa]GBE87812.1 Thiamin pyrophosphokinase 1 [Sparassis crispa]